MCGVCGIVQFDAQRPDLDALSAMSRAMKHRGPDDSGLWHEGPAAFAHRRLSIIDLEGSHQPMASHDQQYVLAFNGEILNYHDLRRQIDYPYRTAGDTEVILASHQKFGRDAPHHFSGQFAYALYDRSEQSLILVRDRMGILPLFWCRDGQRVLFSSDMTALLQALPSTPPLDSAAVDAYLMRRAVPAPDTLLSGIRKVRPGHVLTFDSKGQVTETAFWEPEGVAPRRWSADDAVAELDQRLTDSVARALVADVPVGAYLSGGVDSSLITAKVVQQPDHAGVHTFCAAFDDARFDETEHAAAVSRHLGTTHHRVTVLPQDFADLWSLLSQRRGAPLSEPADIAVFRLAQAAREHVKVVVSGEGSDELFAGYPKHKYAQINAAAGLMPAFLRGPALRSVERRLPPGARRFGVALRALSEPSFDERISGWFAPFTSAERASLVDVDTPLTTRVDDHRHLGALRRMLLPDLHAWLPDNLLERGDRMSMAASLELRPPFLDPAIVDFALSLPPKLLVRRGVGKWLVKEVARRCLPSSIVDRPKAGFRVPLDTWFKGGLRDFARDATSASSSVTNCLFDRAEVDRLFARHDHGERDESIRIWTLTSLEVWYATLGSSGNKDGKTTCASGPLVDSQFHSSTAHPTYPGLE